MKYLVIICFIVLVLIGFSFQAEIPLKRDGLNKRDHNSVDVLSVKRRGLFSNIVDALTYIPKTLFGDPSTKSSPSSETADITANINIQEKINFLTTPAKTAASTVQITTPNSTSPKINGTSANVTSATVSLNMTAFNSVITTPRTTSFSLTSTTMGITTGSTKGSSATLAPSSTTTQFNNKIISNINQINDTISTTTATIKDPTTTTSTKGSSITVTTKDTFTTTTTKDPTTVQTPLNLANIFNIDNLMNSIVSTTTDTVLKASTAGSSSSLTSTKLASTSSSTFINELNMLNAIQKAITADAVRTTMGESSTSSSTIATKSTATASNSENQETTIISNGSRFDSSSFIGDSSSTATLTTPAAIVKNINFNQLGNIFNRMADGIGSLFGVTTSSIASSTPIPTTTTVPPMATSSVVFKDPLAFTRPIPTTTSADITSGESKIASTQPSMTATASTTRTTSISTKAAPMTTTVASLRNDNANSGVIFGGLNNLIESIDSIFNPTSTRAISLAEAITGETTTAPTQSSIVITTTATFLPTPTTTTPSVTEITSNRNSNSNSNGDGLIGGFVNNFFNGINSIFNPTSTVSTKSILSDSLTETTSTANTSSSNPTTTTPIFTETTSSLNSNPNNDGLIGGFFNNVFKGIDSILNPASTVSTKSILSDSLTETTSTAATSTTTSTLTTPIITETASSHNFDPNGDGLIGGFFNNVFKGIDSILNPASTVNTKSISPASFIEFTSTPITTAATTESTIVTTKPPFDLSSILQNLPFVGTLFASQPPNSVATDPPTATTPIPTVPSVSPNQNNNDFFNIPFLGPIAEFVDNLIPKETPTVKNVPTTTLAPPTPSPFNFFDNIFAALQPPTQTTPSPTPPPEPELCKAVDSIPFLNLIVQCSAPTKAPSTNCEHSTQAPTNPISAIVENIPIIGDVFKTIFSQSNNGATQAPLFDIWTIMEFLPGIGPVVKFIHSVVTGEIIFQIPIIGPIIEGIVQSCAYLKLHIPLFTAYVEIGPCMLVNS
ncbi:hypothetical protein CHUAL_009899 [Chamberlinius hualienensis]